MKKTNPYIFYKDLLKTSYSVRSLEVEDLFVKFANDYSKQFIEYLHSKHFPKKEINSSVLNAFQLMSRIKEKFGDSISASNVIQYVISNPKNMGHIPTIKSLEAIYSDGENEKVLLPFSEILQSFRNVDVSFPTNKGEVKQSLNLIEQRYDVFLNKKINLEEDKVSKDPKRKTKKYLQKEFFAFAFKHFTKEIQYQLSMHGKDDVANLVKNGGLLFPDKLEAKLGPGFNDPYYLPLVENEIKKTFNKVNQESNVILFKNLQNELLHITGMIDRDFYDKKHEEQIDFDIQELLGDDFGDFGGDDDNEQTQTNKLDTDMNFTKKPQSIEEILGNKLSLSYIYVVSAFLKISYTDYFKS